jgi:DNA-binding SARP family transcriptional activator
LANRDRSPGPAEARGVETSSESLGSESPDVQLKLLGGFELRSAGHPIPLPAGSQRVIAFLALRGRQVGRPCVAEALWFARTQDHALSCLRSAVWRTRSTGVVDATRDRLRLAANVAVDVRELLVLARQLCDPWSPMPKDVDRGLLEGDLLPDWSDEWVEIERLRLRHARLHAIEALAQRFIDGGRFADAIEATLVAIAEDPLRESAQRVLITAHLREGNVAEAVQQYRRYRDLLGRRFNVAPSEAVNRLVRPLGAVT